MSTRAEMAAYGARVDANVLRDAITIIRRERLSFDGTSRAAVIRQLIFCGDRLQTKARELDG